MRVRVRERFTSDLALIDQASAGLAPAPAWPAAFRPQRGGNESPAEVQPTAGELKPVPRGLHEPARLRDLVQYREPLVQLVWASGPRSVAVAAFAVVGVVVAAVAVAVAAAAG